MFKPVLLRACAAAGLLFTAAAGNCAQPESGEVTAVLSGELTPYIRAYDAFSRALGRPSARIVLSGGEDVALLKKNKVTVTFGGRAGAWVKGDSEGVHISCLAPAFEARPGGHSEVVVNMAPSADILVARIKSLQPGLRVLVGLWSSDGMKDYMEAVAAAGAAAGIQVRLYQTSDGKQLENALRNYVPKGGAVWIPPDPLLINVENFGIIKKRSAADAIAVYVPTEGLAGSGGTVSVSVSFEDMGRLAAETARKVLAGESVPAMVYSTSAAVAVNRAAARACGLDFTGQADVKYLEQK